MIVKLSCGCSAELMDSGHSTGESLGCPFCNTIQRIVAKEPNTFSKRMSADELEDEFNSKALQWAIEHSEEF